MRGMKDKKGLKTARISKRGRVNEGRPMLFSSPGLMQAAIDKYFRSCRKHPTLTGLAIAIGFTDRQSLYDYGGYSQEYSCIIKKARILIENYYEKNLAKIKLNPTGSIFALKNMGWRDKQEVEHSGNIGITGLLKEIDGTDKGIPK